MSYDPYSLGRLIIRSKNFGFSRQFLLHFKERVEIKETAGWPLIIFAVIGLAWSNLIYPDTYFAIWNEYITLDLGIVSLTGHLKHMVNDMLLPLFFFVVGLEIKMETAHGQLSSIKRAAMPLAIAAGGIILPATIYAVINYSGGQMQGWGIPMATDVAFALAILSLFGDRIPYNLKILTMAFAVVDDIGAVLVIAFFYTQQIAVAPLMTALAIYVIMLLLLRYRIFGAYILYTLVSVVFFIAMLKSGVHTTIAGVLMGLAVPASPVFRRETFGENISRLSSHFDDAYTKRKKIAESDLSPHEKSVRSDKYLQREQVILGKIDELLRGTESPCTRLRRTVTPFVNYLVLPIFAVANAGVYISGERLSQMFTAEPAWGIFLGLIIGKPAGIMAAAFAADRLGFGSLPEEVGWSHVAGMSILAGIGFTVSLFIADLAFRGSLTLPAAKMSVMSASLIAAVIGGLYFMLLTRQKASES